MDFRVTNTCNSKRIFRFQLLDLLYNFLFKELKTIVDAKTSQKTDSFNKLRNTQFVAFLNQKLRMLE